MDGIEVVIAFKIAGSRASRQPHVIYPFTKNPSDALDHAPSIANLGTHMGLDATQKIPGEGYHRTWPDLVKMPTEVQTRVDAMRADWEKLNPKAPH